MRILGLDTATRATAVALVEFDRSGPAARELLALEARDDPPSGARPRHTTKLMTLIVELLGRAELGWEAIDRIAVGVGPGTFTGLRIGIATARALASARAIPIVGVSTLHSLALGAFDADTQPGDAGAVVAVLDARRGEVFAAAWRGSGLAAPQALAPQALAPDGLATTIASLARDAGTAGAPLAVGEGAVEFKLVLERAGAVVPEPDSDLHKVTAINHCRLAAGLREGAPDDIHPEYLRLPDAEIARRSAGKR